jgi:hypothetical protein
MRPLKMRGPGWIKEMRQADAQRLREQIALLEGDLIGAANNAKGKWKLHEIAHALRAHKNRLELLEECIDRMPDRR